MSKIVVEGVSKRFRLQTDRAHSVKELITRRDRNTDIDHFWALKDVSLEIPEGSMYALVGHNGSGKSTLLRCIAGIYRPTEGSVKVDGRISTLLELGAGFHPDLTGRENVYMNATILGMGHKQIDKVFDEIVEFAGVQDFIDSPVKIYSSGMYVRLGFSVAIHVDPEILIIDEVIAVGDEEFQRKCFSHLHDLRRRGVTIVVVTHGMGTVQTMCDGAAWLDHGRLVMEGNPNEIATTYVQRVNQAEIEQEAGQREAESAGEGDGADAADTARHRGDGVYLTGFSFRDGNGDAVPHAVSGEPFTIEMNYEVVGEPLDSPSFGCAIHSEGGVYLHGVNTVHKQVDTGKIDGVGTVAYDISKLGLAPGTYRLTLGTTDAHVQKIFDRWDEITLVVRPGAELPGDGMVDLGGIWNLSPHLDDVVPAVSRSSQSASDSDAARDLSVR